MKEEKNSSINSCLNNNAYLKTEEKILIPSGANKPQKSNKFSNNEKENFEKKTNNDNKKKIIGQMEEIILINKENENVKKMLIQLKKEKIKNSKSLKNNESIYDSDEDNYINEKTIKHTKQNSFTWGKPLVKIVKDIPNKRTKSKSKKFKTDNNLINLGNYDKFIQDKFFINLEKLNLAVKNFKEEELLNLYKSNDHSLKQYKDAKFHSNNTNGKFQDTKKYNYINEKNKKKNLESSNIHNASKFKIEHLDFSPFAFRKEQITSNINSGFIQCNNRHSSKNVKDFIENNKIIDLDIMKQKSFKLDHAYSNYIESNHDCSREYFNSFKISKDNTLSSFKRNNSRNRTFTSPHPINYSKSKSIHNANKSVYNISDDEETRNENNKSFLIKDNNNINTDNNLEYLHYKHSLDKSLNSNNKIKVKKKSSRNVRYSNFQSPRILDLIENNANQYFEDNKKRRLIKHLHIFDSLSENEDLNPIDDYVISLDSKFRYIMDFLVFIIMIYSLIFTPFKLVGLRHENLASLIYESLFDLILLIDFISEFFKAYYDTEDNYIRTLKKIFQHYLDENFFSDFISALPFNSVLQYLFYNSMLQNADFGPLKNVFSDINNNETQISISFYDYSYYEYLSHWNFNNIFMENVNNYKMLIQLFRLLRLFKFRKLSAGKNIIFNAITELLNFEEVVLHLINQFSVFYFIFLLISHNLTCMFIFFGSFHNKNWIIASKQENKTFPEIYITSLYFTHTTIFSIGYGDILTVNKFEKLYNIFLMVIGVFLYSFALTTITNVIKQSYEKSKAFYDKKEYLDDLTKHYHIQHSLYQKIYRHLYFVFLNNNNSKNILLDDLPLTLKNEVILNMHKDLIKSCKFFVNLYDKEFLLNVLMCLKPTISHENESLITQGDFVEEVIFIKTGTLQLDTVIDIEINVMRNSNAKYKINHLKTYKSFKDTVRLHLKRKQTLHNQQQIKQLQQQRLKRDRRYTDNDIVYLTNENKLDGLNFNQGKNNTKQFTGSNSQINKVVLLKNKTKNNLSEKETFIFKLKILKLRKNEYFGDALIIDNKRCKFTLKTISKNSELFLMNKFDLSKLLKQFPNIFENIYKQSNRNMMKISDIVNIAVKVAENKIEKNLKSVFQDDLYNENIKNNIISTKQIYNYLMVNKLSCIKFNSESSTDKEEDSKENLLIGDTHENIKGYYSDSQSNKLFSDNKNFNSPVDVQNNCHSHKLLMKNSSSDIHRNIMNKMFTNNEKNIIKSESIVRGYSPIMNYDSLVFNEHKNNNDNKNFYYKDFTQALKPVKSKSSNFKTVLKNSVIIAPENKVLSIYSSSTFSEDSVHEEINEKEKIINLDHYSRNIYISPDKRSSKFSDFSIIPKFINSPMIDKHDIQSNKYMFNIQNNFNNLNSFNKKKVVCRMQTKNSKWSKTSKHSNVYPNKKSLNNLINNNLNNNNSARSIDKDHYKICDFCKLQNKNINYISKKNFKVYENKMENTCNISYYSTAVESSCHEDKEDKSLFLDINLARKNMNKFIFAITKESSFSLINIEEHNNPDFITGKFSDENRKIVFNNIPKNNNNYNFKVNFNVYNQIHTDTQTTANNNSNNNSNERNIMNNKLTSLKIQNNIHNYNFSNAENSESDQAKYYNSINFPTSQKIKANSIQSNNNLETKTTHQEKPGFSTDRSEEGMKFKNKFVFVENYFNKKNSKVLNDNENINTGSFIPKNYFKMPYVPRKMNTLISTSKTILKNNSTLLVNKISSFKKFKFNEFFNHNLPSGLGNIIHKNKPEKNFVKKYTLYKGIFGLDDKNIGEFFDQIIKKKERRTKLLDYKDSLVRLDKLFDRCKNHFD